MAQVGVEVEDLMSRWLSTFLMSIFDVDGFSDNSMSMSKLKTDVEMSRWLSTFFDRCRDWRKDDSAHFFRWRWRTFQSHTPIYWRSWGSEYVRFWTTHTDDFFDAVIWPITRQEECTVQLLDQVSGSHSINKTKSAQKNWCAQFVCLRYVLFGNNVKVPYR